MTPLLRRTIEKRRASLLKTKPQARKTFPSEAELRLLGRSVIKHQVHPLIVVKFFEHLVHRPIEE